MTLDQHHDELAIDLLEGNNLLFKKEVATARHVGHNTHHKTVLRTENLLVSAVRTSVLWMSNHSFGKSCV